MSADDASFGSEAVTRGVRVTVKPRFDPERSDRARGLWLFLYTVTITNEGNETVQLTDRHWTITDENGDVEEVRGPGVVGEQPVLAPGEGFTYTSACPLRTPTGTMRGTYRLVTGDGESFDATIAEFLLSEPYSVH